MIKIRGYQYTQSTGELDNWCPAKQSGNNIGPHVSFPSSMVSYKRITVIFAKQLQLLNMILRINLHLIRIKIFRNILFFQNHKQRRQVLKCYKFVTFDTISVFFVWNWIKQRQDFNCHAMSKPDKLHGSRVIGSRLFDTYQNWCYYAKVSTWLLVEQYNVSV
jgi:hypothetical protein